MVDLLKPCPHKQITITEEGNWFTSHTRESDGGIWHNNEPGNYRGSVRVQCFDCGLDKTWRNKSKLPKQWQLEMKVLIAGGTTT